MCAFKAKTEFKLFYRLFVGGFFNLVVINIVLTYKHCSSSNRFIIR